MATPKPKFDYWTVIDRSENTMFNGALVRDLELLVIERERERLRGTCLRYSHTDPGPSATKERRCKALMGMKINGKGAGQYQLVTRRTYWVRRIRRDPRPERLHRVAIARRIYEEVVTPTLGKSNTSSSLRLEPLPTRGVITDPDIPMRGLDSFLLRAIDMSFPIKLTLQAPSSPIALPVPMDPVNASDSSEISITMEDRPRIPELWYSPSGSIPSDLALNGISSESSHTSLSLVSSLSGSFSIELPVPESSSLESDPSECPLESSVGEIDFLEDSYTETDSSKYPEPSESSVFTSRAEVSDQKGYDADIESVASSSFMDD